jgi:hypothetical protein
VQVIQEDAATGMSKNPSAEIGPDVRTLTTFLSKRLIKKIEGEMELLHAAHIKFIAWSVVIFVVLLDRAIP